MTTYIAFRHRSTVVLVANRGDDGSEFVRHIHHHAKRLDYESLRALVALHEAECPRRSECCAIQSFRSPGAR